MSQAELLKPELYAPKGTAAVPDHPALLGGRCVCGHTFFPMQDYGCEICGRSGKALTPVSLSGRGKLVASAKVHIHSARPDQDAEVKPLEPPFTIGSIALDDGPTVRTLLAAPSDEALQPGRIMVTTLVLVGVGGREIVDLRFTPES